MKLLISFLFLSSFVLYDVSSSPVDSYVNTQKKIICYFQNKSPSRVDEVKFLPEHIDANLCTHVVYAYADLDEKTHTIVPSRPKIDIGMKMFERVTKLMNSLGRKVVLSLGGVRDTAHGKYSKLLTDAAVRKNFVVKAVEFLQTHNFDGLDLAFLYVGCWDKQCDPSRAHEKEGFVTLVKELSFEFKKRGLLLSIVVSGERKIIDFGYDIPKLNDYVDWMTTMTFDYHTTKGGHTGLNAPLTSSDGLNVDFTVKYLIKVGIDTTKLIMGIPTYGRSFTLKDSAKHGLNDLITGPGKGGNYTQYPGILAFYEVCSLIQKDSYHVVRDTRHKGSSLYAYHSDQWITFDDVEIVRAKAHFAKEMNLGGAFVGSLSLGDFLGKCGCGKYPLLNALNYELRGIGTRNGNCI